MSERSQSSKATDPTALEYSRANELSRNYLAEELGISDLLQLPSRLQDNSSDAHLPQLNLGPEPRVEERMTLQRDAAFLLQSVTRDEDPKDIDAIISSTLAERQLSRPLKVELPLLRSDHERDCRLFASREGFDIKPGDVKLPLEVINDEKNEGFIFSPRFWNMGEETLQKLKAEKMSASKETITYLAGCLQIDWSEDDANMLWDSEQTYKRNTARDPLTPPLSPAFKPLPQPYEPTSSDSAYQVPLTSSPMSSTKGELEALEKMIFEQDIPTPLRKAKGDRDVEESSSDTLPDNPTVKLSDIFPALASLENTPPSLESKRVKREDLKVEELLTPDKSEITLPKSVRFNDVVEEMILDPESRFSSPVFEQKYVEEAFGDALREANQQAEQEKLVAADATARVDVPIMDFSNSDPPWTKFEAPQSKISLASVQISFIRDVVGQRLPKCVPANNKDIKLKWTPFPNSLAKVAVEEDFPDDDCNLETFLKQLDNGEIINSSSLTWKREGLRILKDDEEEDEIEFGRFRTENPRDLSSLVKKRKMEMQEAEEAQQERAPKKVAPPTQQVPANQTTKRTHDAQGQMKPSGGPEPGLIFGDAFSAESCLENFLELRASKKAKITDSNFFVTKPNNAQLAADAPRTTTPQLATTQFAIRKSPVAKAPPLPAPTLPTVLPVTSVIISTALLKNRSLITHIEHLLPALNIIERDFATHNTTTWQPGSVTRSPIKSSLDSEADIIVSPSTGIVITTLLKIKQKPPPGQKTKPAIRDQVERVSARYEKLIVLVFEGRGDETTLGLDESDCLAYSEFAGFASGFETSITPLFVAGGKETLAKWLASTIMQHCLAGESSLLAEETHWELFLRRAGMNAFAAQTILADLKAPDGVDTASPSKAGQFGLTAFVEMGREQRIARFGPLCGRMLLERVSTVIDGKWD